MLRNLISRDTAKLLISLIDWKLDHINRDTCRLASISEQSDKRESEHELTTIMIRTVTNEDSS